MSFEAETCDLDILLDLLEENVESNDRLPVDCRVSHTSQEDTTRNEASTTVGQKTNAIKNELCNKDMDVKRANSVEEQPSSANSDVDPLERELCLMEERMQKLRKEISKKKNLKSNDDKPIGFTKLCQVISPSCSKSESSARYLTGDEKEELMRKLSNKNSEIHSGDTDSEDDEDNRTPFEAHLTSYGREMKTRMAHSREEELRVGSSPGTLRNSIWKGTNGHSLLPLGSKVLEKTNSDTSSNAAVDPFSGIRIINPLVSVDILKDLMSERRMIQISAIVSHIRGGEIEGNWVTIGVIVSKTETKTSQKGSQYSIWQMNDLKDCTKVVSLFLFAGAYKGLWKTTVGSVVGILNPQIMKESNRQNDGRNCLTLSVNTHEKILLMGASKDLGWCKSRNKQGSNCRQFVNKNVCEVCVFHIQKEYQKMSSKRAEIQSSFARVDPRKSFQNRFLGNDQVFYGGQLYQSTNDRTTASVPKRTLAPACQAKDLATLSSLTTKLKAEVLKEKDKKDSFVLKRLTDEQLDTVKTVSKDNEELGLMLLSPSPGARNLLLHKTNDVNTSRDKSSTSVDSPQLKHNLSAKNFLASVKSSHRLADVSKRTSSTSNNVPLLGRGLSPTTELEFDVSSQVDPTKAKANAIIKMKGGITPVERNVKRNRQRSATSDFQVNVRKRIRELPDDDRDETTDVTKKPKGVSSSPTAIAVAPRKSLLGSVDINSDKFMSMMKTKSSHTNLVQATQDEEVEKYYDTLEKKETLENKMASTKELACKAVICLQCKYKAMSASDHCRQERHTFKIIEATKRFFECRNCKRRTVSLEKLPGKPCSHCSESSWRRVGMAREKKGPKLESEILCLRGDELAHISSSSNEVYINI